MKVISLFDGMACGLTALKRVGVRVTEYHAFEIDPYAIAIAKRNHPEIIHHGTVEGANFERFNGADLLIGGSPCQGFSFAGKQLAFDDPRSKLFFEYVRARDEIQPVSWLLENVKMKKEHLAVITLYMKTCPILINSARVSAQNRERYYWFNWSAKQPQDKHIELRDIIEHGYVDRDKAYCVDAHYFKSGFTNYFNRSRRQLVFEKPHGKNNGGAKERFKFATLRPCTPHNYAIRDGVHWRKLTPLECERLQTVDEGYTAGISNTQRYKMLGNGWTVDVIAHLFREAGFDLV